MYPFVETISIVDGDIPLFVYHQLRCYHTQDDFYSHPRPIHLLDHLPLVSLSGRQKWRITYGRTIGEVSLTPYTPRTVNTLQLVTDDNIRYDYKRTDRTDLLRLFEQRGTADDILIVRNGLLTDTSFSNIAFLRQGQWYTPRLPLLRGVRRQSLLEAGRLHLADIRPADLPLYEKATLLNGMLEPGEIEINIADIRE